MPTPNTVLSEWQNRPKIEIFPFAVKIGTRDVISQKSRWLFFDDNFFLHIINFIYYLQEKVFQDDKYLCFWRITSCVPFFTANDKIMIFAHRAAPCQVVQNRKRKCERRIRKRRIMPLIAIRLRYSNSNNLGGMEQSVEHNHKNILGNIMQNKLDSFGECFKFIIALCVHVIIYFQTMWLSENMLAQCDRS